MKRLAALVAVTCLIVPVPSKADPGVKRSQSADAIWMVPTETKGRFIGYFASAHLDEPNGGNFSWDDASIGKGRCTVERKRNMTSTSCWFESVAHGKASEAFTMDPLLQTASLSLEHKGTAYEVNWEGGEPGLYEAFEGCYSVDEDGNEEEGEGSGGGILREAVATAHMFGRHLVTKGRFNAMMMSGVMVTECTRRSLADLRPGERRRISF